MRTNVDSSVDNDYFSNGTTMPAEASYVVTTEDDKVSKEPNNSSVASKHNLR